MSGGGLEHTLEIIIIVIVLIVAVVQVLASTVGLIFTSFGYLGTNLTANGQSSVGGFFSQGGLMGLIFGLIVFLLVLFLLFKMLRGSHSR